MIWIHLSIAAAIDIPLSIQSADDKTGYVKSVHQNPLVVCYWLPVTPGLIKKNHQAAAHNIMLMKLIWRGRVGDRHVFGPIHCAAKMAGVNVFLDSISLQDWRSNPFDDDDVGRLLIMFILSINFTDGFFPTLTYIYFACIFLVQ